MARSQEFLTSFHNLGGTTLGEKRKNFCTLLNTYKLADQKTVDAIVSSITPKNYIESVFRIETLIYFKKSSELFEALKTESNDVTRKIFKSRWFFQEPFDKISAEAIVKDLLPHFSVVIRLKVIRNLSKFHKNEQKVDVIFDQLNEKYGFFTARQILSGCSEAKIENVLTHYNLILTTKELKILYRKAKISIRNHVELFSSNYFNIDYRCFLKFIPSKEPDMFFKFVDKFANMYNKISRRATRRVIKYDKANILEDPNKYIDLLNLKLWYKSMKNDELKQALRNLCPSNMQSLRYYVLNKLLWFVPSQEKYSLYSEVFQEVYGTTLLENSRYLDEDWVEKIPDVAEREKWIAAKIKEGISDTHYMNCYELTKSFDLIKSKMNVTSSVRVREVMLEKLIDVCVFYNDKEALLEALKYICKRHRNDSVLPDALNHLSYAFRLSDLTAEHWKYIHEIVEVSKLKHHIYNEQSILLEYIVFLWKNKLQVDEKILELIKRKELNEKSSHTVFDLPDKDLQKKILNMLLEYSFSTPADDISMQRKDAHYVTWIIEWNKRYPDDIISLDNYPRLIASLKAVLQYHVKEQKFNEMNDSFKIIFDKFLCTNNGDELTNFITDAYFSCMCYSEKLNIKKKSSPGYNYNHYALEQCSKKIGKVILWYLQNSPKQITKYVDNMVIVLYENIHYDQKILYHIKAMDFCNLQEKIIAFGLTNYERSELNTRHALNILRYFMLPQDYIQALSKHIPLDDKMDIDDESYQHNLSMLKAIGDSFKYTMFPSIIPTIFEFCKGDYIKCVLGSLYFQFLHCPESKLVRFRDSLLMKPSPVCKHAYYLTCQFTSAENVVSLFQSFINTNDPITKKDTLIKAFKYFKKSNSKDLFNLILPYVGHFKKTDKLLLKLCQKAFEPSDEHKAKFFLFLIHQMMLGQSDDSAIPVLLNEAFTKLDAKCMQHLSADVSKDLIENLFLNPNPNITEENVNSFLSKYMFTDDGDVSQKYGLIFNKISDYKAKSMENFKDRVSCKKKISELIMSLYCKFKDSDVQFLEAFYEGLLKTVPLEEYFVQVYTLYILLLYKRCSNDLKSFSIKLYALLEEIHTTFGPYVSDIVVDCIKHLFKDDSSCDEKLLVLCSLLYEINKSTSNCSFILDLLPRDIQGDKEKKAKFFSFLESLQKQTEPNLEIKFNLFLLSL